MDAEAQLELLDGHLRQLKRLLRGEGAEPGEVSHLGDAAGAERTLGLRQLLGDGGLPLDEALADDVPDEVGGALARLGGGEQGFAAGTEVPQAERHRVVVVFRGGFEFVVQPALQDLSVEGVEEEVGGEVAEVGAQAGVVQQGREQNLVGGRAGGGDLRFGYGGWAASLDTQPVGDGALGDAEAAGDALDVRGTLDGIAHGEQHGSQAVDDAARLQG